MVTLEAVEQARGRIAGKVRRTPLIKVDNELARLSDAEVWLKLECLQATGSFKARGATSKLMSLPPEALRRGIVTASGGNHGLAVARAGRLAGVPATIFVPENASPEKIEKLAGWGADVRVVGKFWDESNRAAAAEAQSAGAAYFHPFADPLVVAGQGTLALEIIEELADIDLFLVAIGGGGLITGMSAVIRELAPKAKIVGIEPVGAPTLHASVLAGEVVTLPTITTRVATMACGRTDDAIFEAVRGSVDEIVLIRDEDMMAAAKWLWFEMGIAADLSGAAGVAALMTDRVKVWPGARVCTLVCGAGSEAMTG